MTVDLYLFVAALLGALAAGVVLGVWFAAVVETERENASPQLEESDLAYADRIARRSHHS